MLECNNGVGHVEREAKDGRGRRRLNVNGKCMGI